MTSNVGARSITDKNTLGFSQNESNKEKGQEKEYETIKKDVMAELKKQFRPEFINRIDDIIVFHKLTDDDISKIIDIMLKQVKKRLSEQEYEVELDNSVKDLVAKKGIDTNYGARPLKRAIQGIVEDKIAEAILDGKIIPHKKVTVYAENDEIKVK